MTPDYPARPATGPSGQHLDAGRLWAGGVATALVAALIAAAGILITRGLFGVSVLAPDSAGVWGNDATAWYVFCAGMAALAATALMHLLVTFTPRPGRFFGWVMALVTAVATVAPLTGHADPGAKLATAVLNLVLGVAVGSLVAGTARVAVRPVAPGAGADPYADLPPL